MTSARASVLERFNEPLVVREYPLPTEIEPGGALVRTEMAGMCGTDVHLWRGELPMALPVILGHETVGRIERLGEGRDRDWTGQPLSVGDRVGWNSSAACGICYYCAEKRLPTRCPSRRAYGIGYKCDEPPHFLGGYAEYHYLRPDVTMFRLPDDLPTEAMIGAGCALITAIHGLERICVETASEDPAVHSRRGEMPVLPSLWKDSVVIQGAGPVGIAALTVAKNAGAGKIIVVGGPAARLAMARRFGADEVIDLQRHPEPEERLGMIREMTGGHGADVVLECVGRPEAVVQGMEMCRDGGKYLVLGHYCDAGPVSWNPHVVTRKQLQVFGSWSGEARHLKAGIEFLRRHQREHPFAAMVTHRFSLDQVNEALAATGNWVSAKSVIVPGA